MQTKKTITTIGWGNWHSNLLKWIYENIINQITLYSIVSMSDDWRTTGKLMKLFEKELNLHFPPPWDLRRCLFSVSGSKYREEFIHYFALEITTNTPIKELTLEQIFRQIWATDDFIIYLKMFDENFLDYHLPINSSIKWHKLWNILMWTLFYNLDKSYGKMMKFMSQLLQTKAKIIPVTKDKAYIEALLEDWTTVQTQDKISNEANYKFKIKELKLMENSKNAKHNEYIDKAILNSDYIIISAWDLFTSNISNLIIWWVRQLLKNTKAKIIFIWNNTNKWWETKGYKVLDFILKLEHYLWKEINYFIANNKKPELTQKQLELLKKNISVKWGDYIFLENEEKEFLKNRWTKVIEDDLIDKMTLYKHNNQKLTEILKEIIL